MAKSNKRNNNDNTMSQLVKLREAGSISETTFKDLATQAANASNGSGTVAKTTWTELGEFPIRIGEHGSDVARATVRHRNGVDTPGVSLGIKTENGDNFTKRFIPSENVPRTIEMMVAADKVAKAWKPTK